MIFFPLLPTADEELEMVQKSKQTEMNGIKGVVDGGKKNDKPEPLISEETRKEMQEESEKAEDDTMAEPPSGKEGEWCSDDGVVEGQKQEGTTSESEK